MRIRIATAVLSLLLLASCGHVISAANRQGALTGVPFSEVRDNPVSYLNQKFVLGGTIVETAITDIGSEIEVIQNPIDRYGYIVETDYSEGRFIVISGTQLDPEIFSKGRYVTVAGVLSGTKTGKIGNAEYRFPVLTAVEIHLWKDPMYYQYPYPGPYGYYDPFYYPPYTAPYYYYRPVIVRPHIHRR